MLVPAALSHVSCGLASSASNIALAANIFGVNPAFKLPAQYQHAVRIVGVTAIASSIGIAVLARHLQDQYTPDTFSPGRDPSKPGTVPIAPSTVNIKFSRIHEASFYTSLATVSSESSPGIGASVEGNSLDGSSSAGDVENVPESNGSANIPVLGDGSDAPGDPSSDAAVDHSERAHISTIGSSTGDGQAGGPPPPPPPPSSTTSGMDNKDDSPRKFLLSWKSILVALALLACLCTAFRRRKVHGEVPAVEQPSFSTTFEDNQDFNELGTSFSNSLLIVQDMSQVQGIMETILTVEVPWTYSPAFWVALPSTTTSPLYTLDKDPLPSPVSFPSATTPIRIDAIASSLGVVNAAGSKLSKGCQQGQPGVIDRLMSILNFMFYLIIASLIVLLSALTRGLLAIISTLEKNSAYQNGGLPSPIIETEVEPVDFLPTAICTLDRDEDEDLGTPLDDAIKPLIAGAISVLDQDNDLGTPLDDAVEPPIVHAIRVRDRDEDEDSDNGTILDDIKWMSEPIDRIHDICAANALAHARAAQLAEEEATIGTIVQEAPQSHERDDAGNPVIADDSPATVLEGVVINEVEVAVGEAVLSTLASSSGFECEVAAVVENKQTLASSSGFECEAAAVVDNEQTLASSSGFNCELAAVVESTPPLLSVSTPGLNPDAPVFTPGTALPQPSSIPVFGTPFDDAVRPPTADQDEDGGLGTPLDDAGKPLIADDSPATVQEGVISGVGVAVGEAVHSTLASSSGFDCEVAAVVESTPPLSSVSTPGLNPDASMFTPETPPPRPSSIPVFVPGRRRRKRRRRGPQETPAEGSISD